MFAGLERRAINWWYGPTTPRPPPPLHLDELPERWPGPAAGHRLHLMLDGKDPEQGIRGDDWVGANIFVTDDGLRKRQRIRMRFVSPDQRNDWTAEIGFAIRHS